MLNGQKLQGVQTARELHIFLKARGKVEDYPLFTVVVRFLSWMSVWLTGI